MSRYIPETLRLLVARLAIYRHEYCRYHQNFEFESCKLSVGEIKFDAGGAFSLKMQAFSL